MVKAEAICRVFRIKCDECQCTGSAFTIEYNGEQFLVTAKHLFSRNKYKPTQKIALLLDNGYQEKDVEVYYHDIEAVDIAVLRLKQREDISPRYENPFSSESLAYSQDMYFLGFPYDYDQRVAPLPDRKIPMPFVKKGCLSGFGVDADGIGWLYIDGINNPGFSGGPACANIQGKSVMGICGVVCSYRFDKSVLFDDKDNATPYHIRSNTGIVNVCDIKHVFEIFDQIK